MVQTDRTTLTGPVYAFEIAGFEAISRIEELPCNAYTSRD